MTNTLLLQNKVKERGLKIAHIAKALNISREQLYRKIRNITEFKASEIVILTNILNLTLEERDKIFLQLKVN